MFRICNSYNFVTVFSVNNYVRVMNVNIDNIIDNLLSLHPLLYKNLIRPTKSKASLNPGTMLVLFVLKRHDMLPMSEIGRQLSMPKPHVTSHVDKLIEEKMVERVSDPNDRRIIKIKITPKGLSDLIHIKKEISENLRAKLVQLDEEVLITLFNASKQVKDILIMISDNTFEGCKSEHK